VDARIRSQSYRLLTWSYKTTTIIPRGLLYCVVDHLRYLHDEGDAHYRGDILVTSNRLIGRLQASAANLEKGEQNDFSLGEYSQFLGDLASFLKRELYPNISYQRHIIALQTIRLLLASSPGKCRPRILEEFQNLLVEDISLANSLLNLLLDPFEDVREISMIIVQNMIQPSIQQPSSTLRMNSIMAQMAKSPDLIKRVESLAAINCRSDHADGLGRLYGLNASVQMLQGLIHRLQSFILPIDAFELPSKVPLHGILLGVMYGIADSFIPEDLQRHLLSICSKIWTLSQPQLCIDSPEFANEEVEDDSGVGPKDLLAYSWRALRDSR